MKSEKKYEFSLFTGGGGSLLAGQLLGWQTVCAVENNPYCIGILLSRQNDGILDCFPVWDDVRTISIKNPETRDIMLQIKARAPQVIITAGFPCQDISTAGNGAGLGGEKSSLFWEAFRIVCEIRPGQLFLENSPNLTNKGLGEILGALAKIGYDARWTVMGASDVGGNHYRKRIWILANAPGGRCQQIQQNAETDDLNQDVQKRYDTDTHSLDRHTSGHDTITVSQFEKTEVCGHIANANGERCEEQRGAFPKEPQLPCPECGGWWQTESPLPGVDDGLANRVGQLTAIGNGQVPMVAATAYLLLNQLFKHDTERSNEAP